LDAALQWVLFFLPVASIATFHWQPATTRGSALGCRKPTNAIESAHPVLRFFYFRSSVGHRKKKVTRRGFLDLSNSSFEFSLTTAFQEIVACLRFFLLLLFFSTTGKSWRGVCWSLTMIEKTTMLIMKKIRMRP
jgi:hypothetical protein